jgi:hypothetical protein
MRKDLASKVAKLTAELEAKLQKVQTELMASEKQVKALNQVKQNLTSELNIQKDRNKAVEDSGRITKY